MARALQQQATQTYNTARGLTGSSESAANALYNQLNPFYSAEMTNPQGISAQDLAAANTAVQQSAGGAAAGAVGMGNLEAARTRNTAGLTSAADESARAAMQTAADKAQNLQVQNALLKTQQQQEGAAGLGRLYQTQNQDVLASLGLQNTATDVGIKAGQSGWFQNMLGLMNAIKPGGSYTSGGGGWSLSAGG
jgi:hypothetical protein